MTSQQCYQYLSTKLFTDPGRCEFFFEKAESTFSMAIKLYTGAFLNTCGGVAQFGIRPNGFVVGVECSRSQEDAYRLECDNVMKFFQPKVSPSLYRMDFVPVKSYHRHERKVIALHVSAGPDIIYMDGSEQVMTMTSNGIYGPLIPQEIQRLAIHKYKEDLLNAENLMKVITPFTRGGRHTRVLGSGKKKRTSTHGRSSKTAPQEKAAAVAVAASAPPKPRSPLKVSNSIATQTTPKLPPVPTRTNIQVSSLGAKTSTKAPTETDATPQALRTPANCIISRPASTPASVICLDDTANTIISINSSSASSDSDCYVVVDDTANTPVRNPSDLFASPGCSTVKKKNPVDSRVQQPSPSRLAVTAKRKCSHSNEQSQPSKRPKKT